MPTKSSTDTKLLAAAKAGDSEALEKLLASQQQRIWRFSVKMCRNSDEAGDVLQDTLLAAARTVRGFRGASSLSTWLYTIARSYCVKRRRRSKFAPVVEESLDPAPNSAANAVADDRATPEDAASAREVSGAVAEAVRRLEPKYREVLVLRDMEGLTAPEVAKVLGIRVEAVKSRLHRARASLREVLAPAMGIGEPSRPTPTCPDVVTLFSKYLEDDIDAKLCARMQEHVAHCVHCQGACDSLQEILSVCRATPTVQVPPDIQASVRGALSEFLARQRPARGRAAGPPLERPLRLRRHSRSRASRGA